MILATCLAACLTEHSSINLLNIYNDDNGNNNNYDVIVQNMQFATPFSYICYFVKANNAFLFVCRKRYYKTRLFVFSFFWSSLLFVEETCCCVVHGPLTRYSSRRVCVCVCAFM